MPSKPKPRAAPSHNRIDILVIASCRSKGVVKFDGTLRAKTGYFWQMETNSKMDFPS